MVCGRGRSSAKKCRGNTLHGTNKVKSEVGDTGSQAFVYTSNTHQGLSRTPVTIAYHAAKEALWTGRISMLPLRGSGLGKRQIQQTTPSSLSVKHKRFSKRLST